MILFIGLALAGALILGDDFQSSSNGSHAAKYTARVQQVASGAQMYQLKTGDRIGASRNNTGVGWLTPRFIKVVPTDPNATDPATYTYTAGTVGYAYLTDSRAKAVCEEIQRTSNQIGPSDAPLAPTDLSVAQTKWPVGCVIHGGQYTVYAAI